jgi:hypothetical protein
MRIDASQAPKVDAVEEHGQFAGAKLDALASAVHGGDGVKNRSERSRTGIGGHAEELSRGQLDDDGSGRRAHRHAGLDEGGRCEFPAAAAQQLAEDAATITELANAEAGTLEVVQHGGPAGTGGWCHAASMTEGGRRGKMGFVERSPFWGIACPVGSHSCWLRFFRAGQRVAIRILDRPFRQR